VGAVPGGAHGHLLQRALLRGHVVALLRGVVGRAALGAADPRVGVAAAAAGVGGGGRAVRAGDRRGGVRGYALLPGPAQARRRRRRARQLQNRYYDPSLKKARGCLASLDTAGRCTGTGGKKRGPAPYRIYNLGNTSPVTVPRLVSILETYLRVEAKEEPDRDARQWRRAVHARQHQPGAGGARVQAHHQPRHGLEEVRQVVSLLLRLQPGDTRLQEFVIRI
jgi:hypothetical protein